MNRRVLSCEKSSNNKFFRTQLSNNKNNLPNQYKYTHADRHGNGLSIEGDVAELASPRLLALSRVRPTSYPWVEALGSTVGLRH